MDESIFSTIKKMLGYGPLYDPDDAFDLNIMISINTYLGVLNDFGVGKEGFAIESEKETWEDFLEDSEVSLNEAKTYLYMRVKQAFDPPASSVLAEAYNKQIDELGWRMMEKVACAKLRGPEV